ncbi:MAG: fused MFS/spermidine synthase [Candidatus Omnitrophica bacterium]|jgi:predicted membrane-bound spermidine synthase|nr:fused MFS/spermidine synthase [Candidatus Omnitrophota bacterium]
MSEELLSDIAILKLKFKSISACHWLKIFSFLSGIAALIYEVIWTRIFANILGSTAFAMSCVFSAFLLCLAIGAHLGGKFIQKKNPDSLQVFGWIEILIAGWALFITYSLIKYKINIAVFLPSSTSLLFTLIIQLTTVLVLIGVPSILMGTTFPLIVTASKQWAAPEKTVTSLYGWNTIGGALGSFLCGFILILHLGLYGTVILSFGLNLLVGLVSLLLASTHKNHEPISYQNSLKKPLQETSQINPNNLLILFTFFSGFTGLSLEILWGRLAKFFLGDRTLATSALLTIYLLCLGTGSFLAAYLHNLRHKLKSYNIFFILALLFGLSALTQILSVRTAYWVINNASLQTAVSTQFISLWRFFLSFLIMAIPVTIAGITFPFLLCNMRNLAIDTGKTVGHLYFVNTVASTLGGIFSGYFISRTIGTLGGFFLISAFLMLVSLVLVIYLTARIKIKAVFVLVLMGLFIHCSFSFPTSLVKLSKNEQVIASNEDEYGVQVISRFAKRYFNVRNNRLQLIYYLGPAETSIVQQMQAYLPMLYAPHSQRVLNIGTGYGITAGTFTLYPQIKAIETVEILPFLAQKQNLFSEFNFQYFKDPRVKLVVNDGRHYLNSDQTKYDIISVNVLDPYLPGSADLFTLNFWQEVKKHLNPGGVMVQLIWGKDIELLLRGLAQVFPQFMLFPAYHNSFNVLAFNIPGDAGIPLPSENLPKQAKQELLKLLDMDPEIFFRHTLDVCSLITQKYKKNLLSRHFKRKYHTDNYPILEYQWAAGTKTMFDSPSVLE